MLDAVSVQDEQSRMDMEARIRERQHEPWFDRAYQAFTSQEIPDSDTALTTLTQTMLVMVGSHDFICSPLHAHRLHLEIADSKFILIEKAGHLPWFEQPDQFFSKVQTGLTALR